MSQPPFDRNVPLGEGLPNGDKHAISVYIPTWEATQMWARRDRRVLDHMKTGYPRFFRHPYVALLENQILALVEELQLDVAHLAANVSQLRCLLFASRRYARQFEKFLAPAPTLCFTLGKNTREDINGQLNGPEEGFRAEVRWDCLDLFAVVFTQSPENARFATAFWQHTGYGISSRYAEICLLNFKEIILSTGVDSSLDGQDIARLDRWRERKELVTSSPPPELNMSQILPIEWRQAIYAAPGAKQELRQQIAALVSSPMAPVKEKDVYLYPTGMAAMTEVGHALKEVDPEGVFIFLGFPYVDTVKTITVVQGRQYLFINDTDWNSILDIECMLNSKEISSIAAVFVELPGNPLLRTPDMVALRRLADNYHFPVVIDDTVGTSVNTDVLRFADIVCTSLSKLFSGACNVMGGSVVINPKSEHDLRFRNELSAIFIDTFCPLDAIVMVENSKDFAERVEKASANALFVAQQLREHSTVAEVYYPKFDKTSPNYEKCMRPGAGYGYLLSVDFKQQQQAVAFFDSFHVAKGPSLGTNFTLACPYTLYAHPNELEHAASFGMDEFLVRISVGLEDYDEFLKCAVAAALNAAQQATMP